MSTDLDTEWEALQLMQGLQVDAALVTSLVMQGRSVEADAHLETCRYRERLDQWRALTGKPALR